MFDRILRKWKLGNAAGGVEREAISAAVLHHLRTILSDKSQGIGKQWSDEGKEKLISTIVSDIDQQLAAKNPVQAVRMRTIEFMILSAKFDVLIMQKPTPHKELSGGLKPHIPELSKVDDEIKLLFSDTDATSFDQMWNTILMRYWVMHLYMNSYNIVRRGLNDCCDDNTKDWFRPCYTSLCISQENSYRQELGLPLTIEGGMADLKSVAHSSWIFRAEEGHRNLRMVWEKSWEEAFREPSPYAGV
jgi:hypothetical protein